MDLVKSTMEQLNSVNQHVDETNTYLPSFIDSSIEKFEKLVAIQAAINYLELYSDPTGTKIKSLKTKCAKEIERLKDEMKLPDIRVQQKNKILLVEDESTDVDDLKESMEKFFPDVFVVVYRQGSNPPTIIEKSNKEQPI